MLSMEIISVLDGTVDRVRHVQREAGGRPVEILSHSTLDAMRQAALLRPPDLFVIDMSTARVTCGELFALLRSNAATAAVPVIVLVGPEYGIRQLLSLEAGADDALREPFGPREPAAMRIQRRGDRLWCGRLLIDVGRKEVVYAGRRVDLTAMQFRILELLASSPGRVLSREQISAAVRDGDAAALDRAVDAHIKAIRRKLGDWNCIQTVRGFGYRLVDPGDAQLTFVDLPKAA
jgi:two-component system phosphate regulon response regulator OmpR